MFIPDGGEKRFLRIIRLGVIILAHVVEDPSMVSNVLLLLSSLSLSFDELLQFRLIGFGAVITRRRS